MKLNHIRIVLVEPQKSGNIGSVARAMRNFGLKHLWLVHPKESHTDRHARAMACKALPLLNQARVVETLADALEDCQWAVGFTGVPLKRYIDQKEFAEVLPEISSQTDQEHKIALVFGREDWGLQHEHMDLCRYMVHFAAHPDYPALNLSQAVMIAAYEVYQTTIQDKPKKVPSVRRAQTIRDADFGEREAMYRDIEKMLLTIGFMIGDHKESTMRHIRRILERADLNERDVRILRGVCRQFLWAGKKVPTLTPLQYHDIGMAEDESRKKTRNQV